MPEIEQELFDSESGRQKKRKTQNGKDLTIKKSPYIKIFITLSSTAGRYISIFFPINSNIWKSFNAKVELVEK